MSSLTLRWGLRTDIGRTRRINQDAAMANGDLFVVADGMGGHRGGEVASDIAVGHFRTRASVPDVDELTEAVVEANRQIRARADLDPSLRGMGTTVVALATVVDTVGPPSFAAANVGDSRIYRLDAEGLTQLTEDHSLVAELTRAGQITEVEAAHHPKRNVLTRALGVDDHVAVDRWLFPIEAGDRYLLCSDGLINEVSDLAIEHILRQAPEPVQAAERLVDMANASGGRDNITVVVVDVDEVSGCEAEET
ncbi:MAG: Stp1/IreP family PP2C-type Ser/Thr phosphatase [Acidimicrobiia bacterium]|nr:Stp1/IreP family PP2C-type Ser/Thr phosphatase [Acidimicrobiia bacterium]